MRTISTSSTMLDTRKNIQLKIRALCCHRAWDRNQKETDLRRPLATADSSAGKLRNMDFYEALSSFSCVRGETQLGLVMSTWKLAGCASWMVPISFCRHSLHWSKPAGVGRVTGGGRPDPGGCQQGAW